MIDTNHLIINIIKYTLLLSPFIYIYREINKVTPIPPHRQLANNNSLNNQMTNEENLSLMILHNKYWQNDIKKISFIKFNFLYGIALLSTSGNRFVKKYSLKLLSRIL